MKFDNPRIVQANIDAPEHTIFFDVENPLAETLFGQLTSSLDSRAIDNAVKALQNLQIELEEHGPLDFGISDSSRSISEQSAEIPALIRFIEKREVARS